MVSRRNYVIETDRTVLRPLAADDAQVVSDAVFADPDVAKTLVGDWSDPSTRVAKARQWIEAAENWDEHGYGFWGIHDAVGLIGEGDRLMGFCAVEEGPTGGARGPEIYYALSRNAWRRGLGTETVTAVVGYLFRSVGVRSVEASIYPQINESSVRIARRLDFRLVGRYPIGAYVGEMADETIAYDLWRVREFAGSGAENTLSDAAFRLGLFVGDGAIPMQEAKHRLDQAVAAGGIATALDPETSRSLVAERLAAGASERGFLHYRLARP